MIEPAYQNEDVTLYHGDCLEILPTLETGSFGAVVTDPPYGLEFKGEGWDSSIPPWLDQARRISPVVVFTTAPTTLWDYPRPDWVCCWYRPASNSRSQLKGGFNHWSPVVVYGRPKFAVDSINLHAMEHAYPKGFAHPSPKPLDLMRWIVGQACPEGETVLDPFAGSGTTGVAAMKTGRKAILIERDERYIPTIIDRLKAAETPLFAGLSP